MSRDSETDREAPHQVAGSGAALMRISERDLVRPLAHRTANHRSDVVGQLLLVIALHGAAQGGKPGNWPP